MSLLDEACTVCGVVRRDCLGRPHVPREAADGPPEGFAATRMGERLMAAQQHEELERLKQPPIVQRKPDGTPRYAVPILRHFKHDHLPPEQASVVAMFESLVITIVGTIQNGPERQVALRKLLEAKDAAVRAVMEGS